MPELVEADPNCETVLVPCCTWIQFEKEENKCDILKCVRRYYFSKGDGQAFHYRPLTLKAKLGCQEMVNNHLFA